MSQQQEINIQFTKIYEELASDHLKDVLGILHQAGHLAWIVGGAVRDILMGLKPKDFDLVTSASPDEVEALFPQVNIVGKQFGIVMVLHRGIAFEVASFRADGIYVNGRHPQGISKASPMQDAHRRDFTVNALYYDPVKAQVIDYVGGLNDLQNKTLRAVGVAAERFSEDHLRILRALRFAATHELKIETTTAQAIHHLKDLVLTVSAERMNQEFSKGFSAYTNFVKVLLQYNMLEVLLPKFQRQSHPGPEVFQLPVDLAEGVINLYGSYSSGSFRDSELVQLLDQRFRFSREQKSLVNWTVDFLAMRVRASFVDKAERRSLLLRIPGFPQRLHRLNLVTQDEKVDSQFLLTQDLTPLLRAQECEGLSGKLLGEFLLELKRGQLAEVINSKEQAQDFLAEFKLKRDL